MNRFRLAVLLLAGASMAAPAFAAANVVTACGTVVKGSAELAGDLDCSAHPGPAIVLDGRLALNGFTLRGNPDWSGVDCGSTGRCAVKGPGEIREAAVGISGNKVQVSHHARVVECGEIGVLAGVAKLNQATIIENGAAATSSPGGGGVWAGVIHANRSDISSNSAFGVFGNGGAVRVTNSTVAANGLTSPGCGTFCTCADVLAYVPPKVRRTACGTSKHVNGTPWGVCSDS